MPRRFWLMKSEPERFSITDLSLAPDQVTVWDGVRNYQARNMLRDEVQLGDGVLFYHSSSNEIGVAGTARVARAGYPDPSQFDRRSPYFDESATRAEPRWYAVDVQLEEVFPRIVTLSALKATAGLAGMVLLRKGNRLSVMPVTSDEWRIISRVARN